MKRIVHNLILVFVLSVILLTSCNFTRSGWSDELNGSSWQLISYKESSLIPGTNMTASFENGEIRGNGGCNTYFGSYSIDGNLINIDNLGWTEMACLETGVMEQEQVLMALLSRVNSYLLDSTTLQIITLDGEILKFSRIE